MSELPTSSRHFIQVRCQRCHERIELSTESDFDAVTCPCCGGTFSLVAETATHNGLRLAALGRFELIEQVGMGAHGSVWKARDQELDRVVAIKIPRRSELDSAETEHFLREARAAAQLCHPSIVGVHEVGRDSEKVYIVSDFVHGASLDAWLTGQQLTAR